MISSASPIGITWNDCFTTISLRDGSLSSVSYNAEHDMDSHVPRTTSSTLSSELEPLSPRTQESYESFEQWVDREPNQHVPSTITKEEPSEDATTMEGLTAAPPHQSFPTGRRPRGRPRKHPVSSVLPASKVTKGRSKTGCITCRKRKKKCDEAKPHCMNCEKNAVVCEGYYEKQIWRSGKEKAVEDKVKSDTVPKITLQPIFHGVETAEDKILWRHYINAFSNVLTVEGEARNAFKDILLQLANDHQGLMHSILAVSGKHMDFEAPYGEKILQDNPSTTRELITMRFEYHHEKAMSRLYEDMEKTLDKEDAEYQTVLAARFGQMLCLLLQTLVDGNPRGEHRVHLQAYKTLIREAPPEDTAFRSFITEFFQYHIYADDLLWYPGAVTDRLSSEESNTIVPIHAPRLVGVADSLFRQLSHITTLRCLIRSNIEAMIEPLVNSDILYRAAEIDAAIREWSPHWPPGDSRDRVGMLYKQTLWIHLFCTIYLVPTVSMQSSTPITPTPIIHPPAQAPPQRRASLAATLDSTAMINRNSSFDASPVLEVHSPRWTQSRNPSRTSSLHENDVPASTLYVAASPSSSPFLMHSRRIYLEDTRLQVAVGESLDILDSFGGSEPAQTLLLIPCLIVGTVCFKVAQRDRVRCAVKSVRSYTGLRTCDRAMELLEEVWLRMDDGDALAVWDWQATARRMGLDFLCT